MQGTRLQNQLHMLKREALLSVDWNERTIVKLVIKDKEQELRLIRKTQKRLKLEMQRLLKISGENLTTIPGISTVLAAKLAAHGSGVPAIQTGINTSSMPVSHPLREALGNIAGSQEVREVTGGCIVHFL